MRLTDLQHAKRLSDHRRQLQNDIRNVEIGALITIKIGGNFASREIHEAAAGPILEILKRRRQEVDEELSKLGVEPNA